MGITTKESLTISLKTIHWLQRSCEWGIITKESLTISLKTIHWLHNSSEASEWCSVKLLWIH
jgi:hypothetical protein